MPSTLQASMLLGYLRKRALGWWQGSVNNRSARAVDGMEGRHWEGPSAREGGQTMGTNGRGRPSPLPPQRSGWEKITQSLRFD